MKIEVIMRMTPKLRKDLHAAFLGCKRINPIKRTRKRQIAKAKHMLAWHDHTIMSGHNGGTKRLGSQRGGSE